MELENNSLLGSVEEIQLKFAAEDVGHDGHDGNEAVYSSAQILHVDCQPRKPPHRTMITYLNHDINSSVSIPEPNQDGTSGHNTPNHHGTSGHNTPNHRCGSPVYHGKSYTAPEPLHVPMHSLQQHDTLDVGTLSLRVSPYPASPQLDRKRKMLRVMTVDEPEEDDSAAHNGALMSMNMDTLDIDGDSGIDACQDLVFDLLSQINRGSVSSSLHRSGPTANYIDQLYNCETEGDHCNHVDSIVNEINQFFSRDQQFQSILEEKKNTITDTADLYGESCLERIIRDAQGRDPTVVLQYFLYSAKQIMDTGEVCREFCVQFFVERLLKLGARTSGALFSNTVLHYAASLAYTNMASLFLEHNAYLQERNSNLQVPVEVAILAGSEKGLTVKEVKQYDECAVLLIRNMENENVRKLFLADEKDEQPSRLSFRELLLRKPQEKRLQKTIMAILDTMIEPVQGQPGDFHIHFSILESDPNGRPPTHNSNALHRSVLHIIASTQNKDVINHTATQLLLLRKWSKFARFALAVQILIYSLLFLSLTIALTMAANLQDPAEYTASYSDTLRAMCEIITLTILFQHGIVQINGVRYFKLDYLKEPFSYLEVVSIISLFLVIPLRFTHMPIEWLFASLGYLTVGLSGFKFAAAFKSTGLYVLTVQEIVRVDIVPFMQVFALLLVSLCGSMYFCLRGEQFMPNLNSTICSDNATDNVTMFTTFTSAADLFKGLTDQYYNSLLIGLRTMAEGEAVFDYSATMSYLVIPLYILFLFSVNVILLNMLIAQMSDTYTSFKEDAHTALSISRAWIISRLEHFSLFSKNYRKRFYKKSKIVRNPHELLWSWGTPPHLGDIKEKIEGLKSEIKEQNEEYRHLLESKLDKQMVLLEKHAQILEFIAGEQQTMMLQHYPV